MNTLINWLSAEFSTPLNATAQIIGFIPLALSFFTFLSNKRKKIIFIKIITDCMWALHFFLLGEVVGGSVNAINTVRNVIFSQKHRRWASHIAIPIIFGALTVGSALLRWQEWYSFLPMLGSLLAVIGFWCNDPRNIRRLNLPAVLLWLIYGIITGSISSVLCNALTITSILIAMLRHRERKPIAEQK